LAFSLGLISILGTVLGIQTNDAIANVRDIGAIAGGLFGGPVVGIIAGVIFWLFSFIKNDWLKFIFVLLSLGAYLYLIYFPASAVRAGLMIALYFTCKNYPETCYSIEYCFLHGNFLAYYFSQNGLEYGLPDVDGCNPWNYDFFEPIRKFFKLIFKKKILSINF